MNHNVRFTHKLCRKFILVTIALPAITLADDLELDDAEWRVVVEDSESYQLGLQRLRAFGEIEPYLGQDPGTKDLDRKCNPLNRLCLHYLADNPAAAKAALPDNPDYWLSYLALLEVTPVARLVEEIKGQKEIGSRQDLIQATRLWMLKEVSTKDTLDIHGLHFQVQAHRRLLAESNFLLDKMIYLATVGISLPSINVLMAQRATKPLDSAETKLLEEILQPLSKKELSIRRALRGEFQYFLAGSDTYPNEYALIEEVALADFPKIYTYVAERSERSWSDYWSEGLDTWVDVPLNIPQYWSSSWSDYTTSIRFIDLQLYLLRALREIYDGRTNPGIPGHPPPARWYWQWHDDSEELCLEPGDIHPSLVDQVLTICAQYLVE